MIFSLFWGGVVVRWFSGEEGGVTGDGVGGKCDGKNAKWVLIGLKDSVWRFAHGGDGCC